MSQIASFIELDRQGASALLAWSRPRKKFLGLKKEYVLDSFLREKGQEIKNVFDGDSVLCCCMYWNDLGCELFKVDEYLDEIAKCVTNNTGTSHWFLSSSQINIIPKNDVDSMENFRAFQKDKNFMSIKYSEYQEVSEFIKNIILNLDKSRVVLCSIG